MTKIPDETMKKYGLPTFVEWEKLVADGVYSDFKELYELFMDATDHIPLKIMEEFIEDLASETVGTFIQASFNFFKNVNINHKEILNYRKAVRTELGGTKNE